MKTKILTPKQKVNLIALVIFVGLFFLLPLCNAQDTIDLGNGFKKIVNSSGTNRLLGPTGFVRDSSGMEFLGTSKIITGFLKKSETIYLWAKDDYSRENHAFDIYIWDTQVMIPCACVYDLPDSLNVTEILAVRNEIIFSAKSLSEEYICTAEIIMKEPNWAAWSVTKTKPAPKFKLRKLIKK